MKTLKAPVCDPLDSSTYDMLAVLRLVIAAMYLLVFIPAFWVGYFYCVKLKRYRVNSTVLFYMCAALLILCRLYVNVAFSVMDFNR